MMPREDGRWARRLAPAALGAAALLPLALLETAGSVVPLGLVIGAVAATALLRAWPRTALPVVTAAPLLLALLGLVALAPGTLVADGLAGIAGLGVLVAATWGPERATQRILGGLFLPATSVALAWVVALALPVGTQDLRIALLVLLVALAFLAWALPRGGSEAAATPS